MRKIIILISFILFLSLIIYGEDKNYIILAGDYKFPPFEYLDNENEPRGFCVDLMQELSKEINRPIILKLIPWSQAIKELREKKVDGVELMRVTEERKKEFDFITYFENHSSIVVLSNSNIHNFMDLKGKKISCLYLDVAQDFLSKIGFVIPKNTFEEAIWAVLNGEVDAGVVNYYFARWIINNKDLHNKLKILPDKLFTNYSGIALYKGNPFYGEIQKGISSLLKKPIYNELLKKWFGEEIFLKEEVKKKEAFSQFLIFLSFFIILLLLIIFIDRKYLKKQLSKQSKDITEVYNFLKDTISKNLEEIEKIYFNKIKELFPHCSVEYFKRINGKFLLYLSFPEKQKYIVPFEELDKISGEKYFFKIYDEIISFVVIKGKLGTSKRIFDILTSEFEEILMNINMQKKIMQNQELSSLFDVFSSLSFGDKRIIYENFLKKLIQILDADTGSIMYFSEEDGTLKIKTAVGLPKDIIEKTALKLGERIAGWVAKNKKPIKLDDFIDPRIKSSICYPLFHERKLVGILNVNSLNEYRRFTLDDFSLIEKIAPILSAVLYREYVEEKFNILNEEIVFSLVEAIEARDPYTGGHSKIVRNLSLKLGERIGLKEEEKKILEYASYLHDIGKIKVPDFILKKPDKLSEEEWKIMKMHPIWGEEIISKISSFKDIGKIIRCHHERWDGKGYPQGISGEDIPLFSRIISLADSFQAMTSYRPYRKALSIDLAIREIILNSGKQFDPYLSQEFVRIILESNFLNLYHSL
jgi:putative nucleotidyltransferase with HDIG domain